MVVGLDPETGQWGMPTLEQLKELSAMQQPQIDHSTEGLIEIHHPDGSVSVDLQGRFQEYATVRVGPDGKLIFQCLDHERASSGELEDAPPAPSALDER